MNYEKLISKIERELNLQVHFTDYDFEDILDIKCPIPNNSEKLRSEYFHLMNCLKGFLKTEPNKEMIKSFILNEYKKINSQDYLREEFKLLTLKYNGFNYFVFGISEIKEYFDKIENNLIYQD